MGWIGAVVVCAVKPIAHCGPDSTLAKRHESVSSDTHHQAEGHEHEEEHHQNGGQEDQGSDPTCAEDPACNAIYSAVNTAFAAALDLPSATVLYELFQLSTIVTLDLALNGAAITKERVLLLTHEVCTCVNSFALAPPSA